MKVAGIGFRTGADMNALLAAYHAVGGTADALATSAHKSKAQVISELARHLTLPLLFIEADDLAQQTTLTQSARQQAQFGTGSVSEAAALAAAGPHANLLGPRVKSPCGMATAALAQAPHFAARKGSQT
ncbi:cobalamin biosynthesis protein [Pelagimonas varians]|uniref:Cobalamin biosynthesis protein CbiG n=1 Tax=Pelagimonas varians TaxID=696760 RepID=A0A238K9B1_9RHOB|nr:cobalamin biosynthesis protein [Pelagimonas varians]PYG31801.1 cobalt-precorrin 5A hydrolase [Pelagimonas varians]SMX38556.1 cobalamin biosynthesis protein CbiG [Pelagimonas varians]